MPMLHPQNVHIDRPLTNLTIAQIQDKSVFIADKIFPNVPVSNMTDKYYIYNKADWLRQGDVKPLAPRARPERVGMSLSTDSYMIEERGLATDWDFKTLANADSPLELKAAGLDMLTHRLLLDRETRFIDTYFKSGVWATEYTGTTNALNDTLPEVTFWDDYTNSDPIVDITQAKRAAQLRSGGFIPNIMVVTPDVRDTLIHHPKILSRMNGGSTASDPALVTDAKLAEILGVSRFMVLEAIQNTGLEGLADNYSFMATKRAALFYTPKAPGLRVPAAGYNFTWAVENSSGYGVEVRTYSGEYLAIEGIAEEAHVVMSYDMKVVGNELGVYFNTILS